MCIWKIDHSQSSAKETRCLNLGEGGSSHSTVQIRNHLQSLPLLLSTMNHHAGITRRRRCCLQRGIRLWSFLEMRASSATEKGHLEGTVCTEYSGRFEFCGRWLLALLRRRYLGGAFCFQVRLSRMSNLKRHNGMIFPNQAVTQLHSQVHSHEKMPSTCMIPSIVCSRRGQLRLIGKMCLAKSRTSRLKGSKRTIRSSK